MYSDLTAPSRSCRILVVDDDDAARELTTRHLNDAWPFDHDLVIEEATDGKEAIAKLAKQPWTLVLLDWKMPGPDGGDVLRAMRRAGIAAPVVIITGLELDELAPTLAHYRVGFLHKDDVTAARLHDAVATALRTTLEQRD